MGKASLKLLVLEREDISAKGEKEIISKQRKRKSDYSVAVWQCEKLNEHMSPLHWCIL